MLYPLNGSAASIATALQNRIGNAENGTVGSKGHAERDNDGRRNGGIFDQNPECEPEVAESSLHGQMPTEFTLTGQ